MQKYTQLNGKREEAALLVALDVLTDLEIVERVGICRDTLHQWKKQEAFSQRVNEHISLLREKSAEGAIPHLVEKWRVTKGKARPTKTNPDPVAGYVYLIRAENGLVKIGQTKDIERRFAALMALCPCDISLIHSELREDYIMWEVTLHLRYAKKRVKGEWFRLEESDLAEIKSS